MSKMQCNPPFAQMITRAEKLDKVLKKYGGGGMSNPLNANRRWSPQVFPSSVFRKQKEWSLKKDRLEKKRPKFPQQKE